MKPLCTNVVCFFLQQKLKIILREGYFFFLPTKRNRASINSCVRRYFIFFFEISLNKKKFFSITYSYSVLICAASKCFSKFLTEIVISRRPLEFSDFWNWKEWKHIVIESIYTCNYLTAVLPSWRCVFKSFVLCNRKLLILHALCFEKS